MRLSGVAASCGTTGELTNNTTPHIIRVVHSPMKSMKPDMEHSDTLSIDIDLVARCDVLNKLLNSVRDRLMPLDL